MTSTHDMSYQIGLADPLTGKFTKIANLSTDGHPADGSALRNDNTVVYGARYSDSQSSLNIVDLSTGKIQEGQRYPSYFFTNIAFDKVTKQTFVTSTVTPDSLLFEFLPDQTLRKMAQFKTPFYSSSAYSSSKHLFFLLTGGSGAEQLLAVSTVGPQEGTAIYDVQLGSLGLENLVFDDTLGVLYVWGYTNAFRTTLMSLDYTTGKPIQPFYSTTFLSSVFACTINKEGTVIYSSLNDPPNDGSVLLTVELGPNNSTRVQAERYAMTLSFQ